MRAHAESTATLDASPDVIYGILSDYLDGHPKILPREYFPALEVLHGGRGAGTRFRLTTRALGVERIYVMEVSEPEPGRVLLETDTASELATSFTVDPVDGGRQARVTIATDWDAASGAAGALERAIVPFIMRRIYAKELRQLEDYARQRV